MVDRRELVKAREAARKELKRTDVAYHKALASHEVATEKAEAAESVYLMASSEWDDAEETWGEAVKELAAHDAAHADEFV